MNIRHNERTGNDIARAIIIRHFRTNKTTIVSWKNNCI